MEQGGSTRSPAVARSLAVIDNNNNNLTLWIAHAVCLAGWLACLSPAKHVNLQHRPAAKPRPVRVITVLHQVCRGGAAMVDGKTWTQTARRHREPGRFPVRGEARRLLAGSLVESQGCPPASERPCLPTIASPQASHGSIERERNLRARPIRIAHAALAGSSFFSEREVRCNRRQEFGPPWRSEFELRLGGGGCGLLLLACGSLGHPFPQSLIKHTVT